MADILCSEQTEPLQAVQNIDHSESKDESKSDDGDLGAATPDVLHLKVKAASEGILHEKQDTEDEADLLHSLSARIQDQDEVERDIGRQVREFVPLLHVTLTS